MYSEDTIDSQANSEDIIDTKAESAYALLRQSLSLYSEDTIDTQANHTLHVVSSLSVYSLAKKPSLRIFVYFKFILQLTNFFTPYVLRRYH